MSEKKQKKHRLPIKKLLRNVLIVAKLLALTVPFLSIIAYTNYTVDPAGIYRVEREQFAEYEVVRLMHEGHNVENLFDNPDERLIRREYINQMTQPVETVVAGSSRSALISKEMLGIDSLFNVSVAGGALEDMIGFYGVLYEKGLLPERLILVMDPWMLNDANNDGRYAAAVGDGYYIYLTERMGYDVSDKLMNIDPLYDSSRNETRSFWDLNSESQWNLFSISYFQSSIQRYFNSNKQTGAERPAPEIAEDYYGTNGVIRADGSFSYPAEYRKNDAEAAAHYARMSLPNNIIGLENYTELESYKRQLFIDFLRCVQQDGVEVELLLIPISTVLYDHMLANIDHYFAFFEAEPMYYTIAQSADVNIVGSFDPHDFDYDMSNYYDGYHIRAEDLETYIAPLRRDTEQAEL